MSQLSQLATHLALSPTVPPKVRCKALDILYALGQGVAPPSTADSDPTPTPPDVLGRFNTHGTLPRLDPHGPLPFSLSGPPEMPPGLMDQFEAGLLGGPPGAWTDAITPPPPEAK